jgi:hypothetical protein
MLEIPVDRPGLGIELNPDALTGQVTPKSSHRPCRNVTRCQSIVVTHGTSFSGSHTGRP